MEHAGGAAAIRTNLKVMFLDTDWTLCEERLYVFFQSHGFDKGSAEF